MSSTLHAGPQDCSYQEHLRGPVRMRVLSPFCRPVLDAQGKIPQPHGRREESPLRGVCPSASAHTGCGSHFQFSLFASSPSQDHPSQYCGRGLVLCVLLPRTHEATAIFEGDGLPFPSTYSSFGQGNHVHCPISADTSPASSVTHALWMRRCKDAPARSLPLPSNVAFHTGEKPATIADYLVNRTCTPQLCKGVYD